MTKLTISGRLMAEANLENMPRTNEQPIKSSTQGTVKAYSWARVLGRIP